MGDMRERKIKQSIITIAIILGLCGYYSTQRSAGRLKNAEVETNAVHSGINKEQINCLPLQADKKP